MLNKILGSRFAGIFCFLFAIANRIIFASLYSFIGADTKLQLAYAGNLMAGKGMGATKYFTPDPNNPVFDTQQIFPPGFSFTIIPFLKLTGGNEYNAVYIFDVVVADYDELYPLIANYFRHKGLFDGSNLLKFQTLLKNQTILIFAFMIRK